MASPVSDHRHLRIRGDRANDRDRTARTLLPADAVRVDCHRRLRGPYTGLGGLLRALVPSVYTSRPDLVRDHQVEILTGAPELHALLEAEPETLTRLAVGEERTRFYSEARSRRTPHGIVEFLKEIPGGPRTVFFDNVHEADATDRECLTIMLRRCDPMAVRLFVGTGSEDLPGELGAAVDRFTDTVDAPAGPPQVDRTADELWRAYVVSDGTSDDPAEPAAWLDAEPAARAAAHDARAAVLEEDGAVGHTLGAIPFHREHGSDPTGAGTAALRRALDYCVDLGFYAAAADLGLRGYALTDPETRQLEYCHFAAKAALALISLGQAHRARDLYTELRGRYPLPRVHMSTSYNMAMLYTRFLPKEELDHHLARAYASNGVALAALTEDLEDRAFYTVFQQNGLALVEMHLGHLKTALKLVAEGVDRLNRETHPDKYRLHKSVLIHNRANVYAGMGMLKESMADFDTVIALDPHYPEYYLDRGNMHRRLGDDQAALTDYETAMKMGPPFPELYYNRGDVRAAHGDLEGAVADFGYALELEPGHLDSRINHASLLLESGHLAEAAASVAEGLRLYPDSAHLLCTQGLLALEREDADTARNSFDAALKADPELYQALVNQAVLAYSEGEYGEAVRLLGRALEQSGDDPDLLYNRGAAQLAAGHPEPAAEDFRRALALPGADREEILEQLALCR
ncbi:tetratricopeptide repeat protein [Streptomyces sp. NBC_00287]|uniref:tetratricopeptide repeat protein n=1 Tax=Streptomyces sp. NBC_00287 TaxID=2975702 RepID=UPI002E2C800B|nr:tetratricopeptide repeat protein [Streptomyces sp. NBC_00287]